MALTWQGNNPIKTPTDTPLTSHGPALVVKEDVLSMVYVGKGGQNIWQSTTRSVTFPGWTTNQPVTEGATTLHSNFRPAVALFNGKIHLVYADEDNLHLRWSWFDGTAWAGNLQFPFLTTDPQPALAVHNGQLRLVWHDHLETIYKRNAVDQLVIDQPERNHIYYSALGGGAPLQISSWEEPILLGDGGSLPAMASYNGSLYMLLSAASANNQPPVPSAGLLIGKWQNTNVPGQQQDVTWPGWTAFTTGGGTPLSSGGVALAVHNNLLYVVYPGQGGANLWYASIDPFDVWAGNIQVKTNSVPKTSAPIGLIDFQGKLCLAYKGESSNNLWFSYAT